MSSPVEKKAELQPVHRIFLGELFVFVFFFAGAMSVLVGPLAVPVATAGMTIGAAVVLSGLCFLWLAFTTPMRKAEPRYAFMVLSLMPGMMICVGVLGYQRLVAAERRGEPIYTVLIKSIERSGAVGAPAAASAQIFAEELAALNEEMAALQAFVQMSTEERSSFILGDAAGNELVVVSVVKFDEKNNVHSFELRMLNYNMYSNHRYFRSPNEPWVLMLRNVVRERWERNVEARLKAKGQ